MKTNIQKPKRSSPSTVANSSALLDLRVPKATSSDAPPTQSKHPVDSSVLPPSQFQLQLALMNHKYVSDVIKFADQKAAFVFTIVSAILALYYNSGWFHHFLQPLRHWTTLDYLYFVASYCLLASAFCAFWTVKPRLRPYTPSGLLFWESVVTYPTSEDYCNAVMHLTDHSSVREIVDHQYQLSKISKSKYLFLNASVLFAGVGFVLTVLLILVT